MRRILCNIPRRPASTVCAAVDGGRATTAGDGGGRGRGFLPTDPKPNVGTPHTKPPTDIFGVFVGQKGWVFTARTQLKNEERARKALGILFRDYGGRDIQDNDELDVAKTEFSGEERYAVITNLAIECEKDHEKCETLRKLVIENMTPDDELGDATQNDRVDKLAEIAAEEELDAFVTNSFATKLMIECEPKYEKRFREVIEKVRKKMIRHNGILKEFELVTNLMSKCEGEYEKLLCEVLEKVCEMITQDDMGENDNVHKIEKLAKLEMKVGEIYNFEEKLDVFVMETFLSNLRSVEKMKSCFMMCEVIEKVAEKVGDENLRKIAEEKLDALVTNTFVTETVGVHMNIPYFKYLRLGKSGRWVTR